MNLYSHLTCSKQCIQNYIQINYKTRPYIKKEISITQLEPCAGRRRRRRRRRHLFNLLLRLFYNMLLNVRHCCLLTLAMNEKLDFRH